jgi:hypothetical protein
MLIWQIDRTLLLSAMSIETVMMDATKIMISGECDDHHHQHCGSGHSTHSGYEIYS